MILESLALLCTHPVPFPLPFPSPAGVPTSNSGRGLEMGEEMEETPSPPQAGGQEGGLPNQAVGARLPSQCFPTGDSSPPDKSASTQPQAPAPALGWWGDVSDPWARSWSPRRGRFPGKDPAGRGEPGWMGHGSGQTCHMPAGGWERRLVGRKGRK